MDKVFTEAYVGRLPELVTISQLFERMIRRIEKMDKEEANPNLFPENHRIVSILEKLFGMKKMWFYWTPYLGPSGYCLIDIGSSVSRAYHYDVRLNQKRGFYDTTHTMTAAVFLSKGMIAPGPGRLTGDELLAVVLHEIGHNIDTGAYLNFHILIRKYLLDPIIKGEQKTASVEELYNKHMKKEKFDKIYNDPKARSKYYKKKKPKPLVTSWVDYTVYYVMSTAYVIKDIFLKGHIQRDDFKNGEFFRYDRLSEEYADSIAASYGYGVELVSALRKFDVDPAKRYEDRGFAPDYLYLLSNIMNLIEDPHNLEFNRCKKVIGKLRRDLQEKDFPKDMRSALLSDLRELEATYSDMINCSYDTRFKLSRRFFLLYDRLFGSKNEEQNIIPEVKEAKY